MNAPPARSAPPSAGALDQAAAWFSLLQSGAATDADRSRWQAWLQASEDSRAAWSLVERVSRPFGRLKEEPSSRLAADALHEAERRMSRRRVVSGLAISAGVGSLLGGGIWYRVGSWEGLAAWNADFLTRPGERREFRLADGSQVWLGGASAFDQDYRGDLRRLHLRAGEILVQTAADVRRPFVVDTVHGRMLALGTRFNVRVRESGTQLSVYDGAVQVTPADVADGVVIGKGQQLSFTAGQWQAPMPADPAREAWTRGVLLARDIPLAEVIAELSRYRRGRLTVATAVARLPVLGSFPLDDVDSALVMLERALPIRVRSPLPGWTTIDAR